MSTVLVERECWKDSKTVRFFGSVFGNANVKLRIFILSPNPGASNQTLLLCSTAAGLLWFGIRGVGSAGWVSGECLRFCPATSSLILLTCLRRKLYSCQRQIFSGWKMTSLGYVWSSLFFHFSTCQMIQVVQLATAWYLVFVPDGPVTTSADILLRIISFFPQDKLHCLVHSSLDKRFTRNFNTKWFLEEEPCAVRQENN